MAIRSWRFSSRVASDVGTGSTKEELCLQTASRSRNISSIFKAMKKLTGSSDFLVNAPQHDDEEVFGLAKRRPHVEPNADDDSQCFDNINFYHPKILAKPLRINLLASPSTFAEHDLEVDVLALHVGNQTSNVVESVHHVQESDCDAQQWHILRMPTVGKNTCFA